MKMEDIKKMLEEVDIEVPDEIKSVDGLRNYLDVELQKLNDQLTPLLKKQRVIRAIRDILDTIKIQ